MQYLRDWFTPPHIKEGSKAYDSLTKDLDNDLVNIRQKYDAQRNEIFNKYFPDANQPTQIEQSLTSRKTEHTNKCRNRIAGP